MVRGGSCLRRRGAARRATHFVRREGAEGTARRGELWMTSTKLGEATDRWHRLRRFVRARLDRKSELGLRLTINVILFAAAIWAFAGLLEEVLDNATLV